MKTRWRYGGVNYKVMRRALFFFFLIVGCGLLFRGRFQAAPQLSPAPLNQPSAVGPARTSANTRVSWFSGLNRLSDERREDDFPSIAAGPDGTIWAVWASYSGLYDEIRAKCYRNGGWTTFFPIPGVTGDVWMPQVAVDGSGTPWFVWAQQAEYPPRDPEKVNWDLYGVSMQGYRWGEVQRLTNDAGSDLNHRLKRDSQGRLWLVWQGFRKGQSEIFLRYLDRGKWSQTYQISSDAANGWYPDVAADSKGAAHIVWDSYRNGKYDVLLRTFDHGKLGPEEPVAVTAESNANAAIAADKQDRLWIAYDRMGVNWGKDQGAAIRDTQPGIPLNRTRQLRVVVRTPSGMMEPVEQPSAAMPPGAENDNHLSRLYTDGDGRIWIAYRHKTERPATWTRPWQIQTEQVQNMSAVRGFWQSYVSYYEKDQWIPATQLPHSEDRISSYSDAAAAPNGQMWLAWHTDNRPADQVQIPLKNDVWVGVLTPSVSAKPADLKPADLKPPAQAALARDTRMSPATCEPSARTASRWPACRIRSCAAICTGIPSFRPMAAGATTARWWISSAT